MNQSKKSTRFATMGLAALLASAALVVPSAAHAEGSTDLGPRIERACLRIPNIELRTNNLIARLEGDATTIGSLKWLQVQIDKATKQGRTQLAQALTNRLQVRTKTLEILHLRQDKLPQLKQFCIDHGVSL